MSNVSVIIPVYNAGAYLERCVLSLFSQTLKDIEYIFVDDCSTDESMQVLKNMLEQYPDQRNKVKVVRHEENRGVAATRNTGLENATGEYIGWVDADDYVDEKMFEKLYHRAITSRVDLVWCNFFTEKPNGEIQEVKQTMDENACKFAKALILNTTQGNIWNKLIKRSLFVSNNIRFLEGQDMAEDYNVLFKVLHSSRTIAYLNESLYYCHYNASSVSKQLNRKRIYQALENAKDMLRFIKDRDIKGYHSADLDRFKYLSKRKLLYSLQIDDFKSWRDIFPESNFLVEEGLLTKTHDFLGKLIVKEKWLLVKLWIVLKKARQGLR